MNASPFFIPLRRALAVFMVLAAVAPAAWAQGAANEAAFRKTLERHLGAVSQRDMAGILATITAGPELTLVFPDGSLKTSRDEYLAFHKEWFAETNWSMRFKPQVVIVTDSMATALTEATYTELDGPKAKQPRYSWVSFTFIREGGEWRLRYDQNTRKAGP
jgi:uncharacterized protein (TIGR02246 family)